MFKKLNSSSFVFKDSLLYAVLTNRFVQNPKVSTETSIIRLFLNYIPEVLLVPMLDLL